MGSSHPRPTEPAVRGEPVRRLRAMAAVVLATDGVITDSAQLHAAAWKEAFDASLHARPPPEEALGGVEAARRGGFGLVIGVDRTAGPTSAAELRERGADLVVADPGELLTPSAPSSRPSGPHDSGSTGRDPDASGPDTPDPDPDRGDNPEE